MNETRIGKTEGKELRMEETIKRVKSQLSLVGICRDYGIDLIKRESDYVCLCPFVPESEHSCTIYPETNTFKCSECSAHGDVIKFVQMRENLEFMPALAKLACMLGIDTFAPFIDEGDSMKRRPNRILDLAVDFYYRLLKNLMGSQDPVLGAFFRDRGIDMESVDRFRIGFAPFDNKLADFFLQSTGFHPGEVLSTGLIKQHGSGDFYPFFANRVIFPFLKNGRAVYLTGRSIDQTEPRYIDLPAGEFFKKTIYNSDALRSATKDIYITEGIIDCILAEQVGLSAIALAGITTNDDLAKLLITKNPFIVFDSEESEAGQGGALKLAASFYEQGVEAKLVKLPRRSSVSKVDRADYLNPEGKGAFLSAVQASQTLIEHRIEEAAKLADSGRIAFIREKIVPHLSYPSIGEMDVANHLEMMKTKLYLKTDMYMSLKREVAKARKSYAAGKQIENVPAAGHEMTPEEKAQALDYLKHPGLMQNLARDIRTIGVIGEETNAPALYLFSLTRKTGQPISAVIFGDSSGGKSHLVKAIYSLVPEEDQLVLSSASAKSFEYGSEKQLKHKFIVIQEIEGTADVESTIRVMQSEGRLARFVTIKNEETGLMEATYKDVDCPACIITTTTRNRVHPENSTRIFELYVNPSPEQTAQIHELDREKRTLGWLAKAGEIARTLALHKNIQRLVAPITVIIPFSGHIDFPKDSVRCRRDFPRFLDLIQAVALFRQFQKDPKRTDAGVDYIEADIEDYRVAYELGKKLFASTFSPISDRAKDVLRVCLAIEAEEFTRSDVKKKAREMKIHVPENNKSFAEQLRSLEEADAIACAEAGKGKPFTYVKKIARIEDLDQVQISVIPTPDQIAEKISLEGGGRESGHELGRTIAN